MVVEDVRLLTINESRARLLTVDTCQEREGPKLECWYDLEWVCLVTCIEASCLITQHSAWRWAVHFNTCIEQESECQKGSERLKESTATEWGLGPCCWMDEELLLRGRLKVFHKEYPKWVRENVIVLLTSWGMTWVVCDNVDSCMEHPGGVKANQWWRALQLCLVLIQVQWGEHE